MRSAVRFRSVLLNSARPPLTPPVPRGASLLTPTAGCDVASPPAKPFNVHDLGTYPPYSTAAAREVLCALNACRGDHGELVTEETPKFKVFELMWKHNLAEDLHQYHRGMLRTLVPPTKEEDVRKYLNDMLNSLHFDPNSKLVERDEMVDSVCSFVSRALSGKLDKVTLASLCSTRGSGKTQLIKHCLFKAAADHVHGGAVMVVECGMPRFLFGDVMHMLNQRDASTLSEGDLHCFVVSLIRAHLKQRLGHELDEGVTTIAEAYAAWSRLLAGCSTPLIVFDSIESLPQTTGIARKSAKDTKRRFVEAIAFLLPSGHGLLVAGTLPVEALDISDPTNVCLWQLPQTRLPALTYEGFLKSLVVWGRLSEKDRERATITTRILHYLCGGGADLLKSVSCSSHVDRLLLIESWGDLLSSCISSAGGLLTSEMPSAGDAQYILWAMSALASGTRTPVCLEDAMPHLSGTKWGDATKGILFAVPGTEVESGFPRKREVVLQLPPVLTMVPEVKLALSNLSRVAQDKTIKVPSALKQWPKGLDAAFLHVAVESEEVLRSLTFCDTSATGRGKPYELLVSNAIVGRWYLLWLLDCAEAQSQGLPEPTKSIALSRVLRCDDARLEGITVDLSGGLESEFLPLDPAKKGYEERNLTTLQRNGVVNGHHDLQFAALQGGKRIVVCCRLEKGILKSGAELTPRRSRPKSTADLLLSIGLGERTTTGRTTEEVEEAVHINSERFSDHCSLLAQS